MDGVQQYSLDAIQRAIAYFHARSKLADPARFDRQVQAFEQYPAQPAQAAILNAMRFAAEITPDRDKRQPMPKP